MVSCENGQVSPTDALTRPATSYDVAALAGVSRSTVSRILNGDDAPFPDVTKQRVRDAAAKLRYRPSAAARSLVTGHNDTIVIVAPNSRFSGHVQDALDEVAGQTRPYSANVVLRFVTSASKDTVDSLQQLRPLAVLNLGVLSRNEIVELENRGVMVVPEVVGSEEATGDPGFARLQAEQLRTHGDRPLWYAEAEGDKPEPYSDDRFAALHSYCTAEGLAPPGLVQVSLDIEGGKLALSRVLSSDSSAAIACYNDEVALTLLAAAREMDVEVPGRVAIIGMDDIIAGQLWSPRLTSIRINMQPLIATLAAELRDRLAGRTHRAEELAEDFFTVVPGETA